MNTDERRFNWQKNQISGRHVASEKMMMTRQSALVFICVYLRLSAVVPK